MTTSTPERQIEKRSRTARARKKTNLSQVAVRWGPLLTLIALVVVVSLLSDRFLTMQSFRNFSKQAAVLLVVAIGPTFVILMGCIDLSVEGLMAVSCVFASLLVLNDRNANNYGILGVIAAVAIVTFMGFMNGVIHAKLRIPSFMVTLGMLSVGVGLATWVFGGYPVRVNDPFLVGWIGRGMTLGVPNLAVFAIVLFLIALFVERYTRLGRYVFSIGGGEDLARLSGIPVDRFKIFIFTFGGLYLGIAGVLVCARLGQSSSKVGDFLFPAVTSVVVGGTALTGGVGGVLQTLIGVLIVTVINNGMILLNVHPFIQQSVLGIIVTGAVILTLDRSKIPIIK